MKIRSLASLLALLLIASVTRADDAAPPAPAAPAPAKPEKPHTPLEKQMGHIRKAYKALKAQINDPSQNASSLDLVATIRKAAVKALDLTPAKASDYTGADRDKFLADYQQGMKDFVAAVDKLAAALQANNNAEAAKIYGHLGDLEKKDHKAFRRPEKEGPSAPAPAPTPQP